ncbi:unnamed protein product [Prorocentrum cordatum]|uniref:Uncharacterized protein n=1 Tax=Prorocentrum cordatum TaxID=2364126 RepID=A0ABN9W209_9DINO|nr:unnamed protein product [Polarella glacialis]
MAQGVSRRLQCVVAIAYHQRHNTKFLSFFYPSMPGSTPRTMFTARALSQETEAPLSEQEKGKVSNPDRYASSALTRCPTAELPPFDDQGDDAHEESWGAAALQKDGDAPALLELAPFETVPLRGHRPRRGSAMPASEEAPLRRLRSEAYWEQRAAVARRPAGSRWELGVRKRRQCLDEEGCLGPAAAPTPAAEGAAGAGAAAAAPPAAGAAEGKGAEGGLKSWAGAISRELRRRPLVPVL